MTALHGDPEFEPEKVTAYEIGAHLQPASRIALSVSAFYNTYNDLKTLEPTPGTLFPIVWGNGLGGYTWGVESWGSYQAASWWRLSAGFDLFRGHLTFEPGASGFLGPSQAGNEPRHQAMLKSSMVLTKRITWEIDSRWVDARPNPSLAPYAEVNTSIAWAATEHIRLQVTGANLLHDRHQELPGVNAVPRSVYASLRWSF
jgi:iron complex outermembrane receptor protein